MEGFTVDMEAVQQAIIDAQEEAREDGDADGSAYYLSTRRLAEIVAECVRRQAIEYSANTDERIRIAGRDPAEVVHERMRDLGISGYRLQQLSGVPNTTVARFLRGEGEIVGSSLFQILSTLGLELVSRVRCDETSKETHA